MNIELQIQQIKNRDGRMWNDIKSKPDDNSAMLFLQSRLLRKHVFDLVRKTKEDLKVAKGYHTASPSRLIQTV